MTTETLQTEGREAPSAHKDGLVAFLYATAANPISGRKAMMEMRGSLGARGGINQSAAPLLAPYVTAPSASSPVQYRKQARAERSAYLLAGLFSLWHVRHTPNSGADAGWSMGRSLRTMASVDKVGAEALMRDLTTFPQDQIDGPLLRAVTKFAAEGIRVNWDALHRDLSSRSVERWRTAQRRWAGDFYYSPPKPQN